MKLFVRLIAALSVLLAAATAAIAQASGQGWLGVQVAQVTKADADALGWEDLHGVKVMKTVPGGPAEQAGLMPGDLILSIGGVEADNVQTFVASVSSKGANPKVKLRLIRNGKEKLVSVVLGARPLDRAGCKRGPRQFPRWGFGSGRRPRTAPKSLPRRRPVRVRACCLRRRRRWSRPEGVAGPSGSHPEHVLHIPGRGRGPGRASARRSGRNNRGPCGRRGPPGGAREDPPWMSHRRCQRNQNSG